MSIKDIKFYFEKGIANKVMDKSKIVEFFNEVRDSVNKAKLDFRTIVFIHPVIPTQINGAGIYYGKEFYDLKSSDKKLFKEFLNIIRNEKPNFLVFIKKKNLEKFEKILNLLNKADLSQILLVVY